MVEVVKAALGQITDYDIIKKIGTGAYGKVFLARQKTSNDLVAIKQLDKSMLIKLNKTESVMREKALLK
jgi:cell cycle protein kinase DBF2